MLFDHLYHSGGLQRDDDGNVTPRNLVAWFLLSNDVGPAAGIVGLSFVAFSNGH
jgi:hypothetical protein